jgi:molybdate transport system substrate-binding protein
MRTRTAASMAMGCLVSVVLYVASAPAQEPGRESKGAIQVFAAASATNAIREISHQFTVETGIEVRASFGSSATLARQIAKGADADVFLSADTQWADDLVEKGLAVQKRNLLGNRLVIVVPDDSKLSVTKPEDLASAAILHIALGEPTSVPAGKYAKQALVKLGLWEKLKPKVAAAEDVRSALAYVETGAAEAGIVYATDAAISKKVKVTAAISEELTGPMCYPIVLLKHGKDTPAAKSFYKFLCSPASLEVFRKFGFTTLGEAETTGKPSR